MVVIRIKPDAESKPNRSLKYEFKRIVVKPTYKGIHYEDIKIFHCSFNTYFA